MKLSTIATAVALALTWTTSLKAEEAPAKRDLSFVPFPMLAYDGHLRVRFRNPDG